MKLMFRGCSYEGANPIQPGSDSTDQPKIKLIYRAVTYYINSPAVIASKAVETADPMVTLIYRGNTYKHKLRPPQPYQKPRVTNWRYQIPAED